MRETTYQGYLIRRLRDLFPGAIILKNDPSYLQGIPDLTVFYEDKWATLEVKASADADERPNQSYYVNLMNQMSFSAFIFPENEEEVLNALQQTFRSRRKTRIS